MPQLAAYLGRFDHDLCDALVAGYTAYLYTTGEVEAVGNYVEGIIHIPSMKGMSLP